MTATVTWLVDGESDLENPGFHHQLQEAMLVGYKWLLTDHAGSLGYLVACQSWLFAQNFRIDAYQFWQH